MARLNWLPVALAIGGCSASTASHATVWTAREGAISGGMANESSSAPPVARADEVGTNAVIAGPLFQVVPERGVAVPIALGETVSGRFDASDPVTSAGAAYVDYVFEGRAGEFVTIDLVGGARTDAPSARIDAFLWLLRDSAEIARDDDSLGNLNSRIAIALPANGAYVIRASEFGGSVTPGEYTLTLRAGPPSPPP